MEQMLIILTQLILDYLNSLNLLIEYDLLLLEEQIQYFNDLFEISSKYWIQKRRRMTPRFTIKPTYGNSGWFEDQVPKMTEDIFKENFRMSRESFNRIVQCLSKDMSSEDTNFKKAVPVNKKIAIAITVLSTNCEYREIGAKYGVGKTSVWRYAKLFIHSFFLRMVPELIKWPSAEEFERIAQDFEEKWQWPMAIGAIDGCHIPINPPEENAQDYYNFKGWHSVLCLVICDANYKVYYIRSGVPGRCNDAGTFKKTPVFEEAEKGKLFSEKKRIIGNCEIGYHLLGDSAFALKSWLMKPYIFSSDLTRSQRHFNYRHSRARRVIENTFGRFKARWRRFSTCLRLLHADIGIALQVGFALNNLCENEKTIPNGYMDICPFTEEQGEDRIYDIEDNARKIRDNLKDHFETQGAEFHFRSTN